jgi:hypothetical protein
MKFKEMIELILNNEKKSLTAKEIWEIAERDGLDKKLD